MDTFTKPFAYKVRILPTSEQKTLIDTNIFLVNQLYNFLVAQFQEPTFQDLLIRSHFVIEEGNV